MNLSEQGGALSSISLPIERARPWSTVIPYMQFII